ncbi:MAG: exopolyphosphatase, partial [Nitrospinae bacterium]|nr:exopolyphosphatase [Nitrospinota bacterium]
MKNIITRGDFDGLVCSALLTEAEQIAQIKFAHPRQIHDREIEVGAEDIIVNLPYQPGCALWFDHHLSEQEAGHVPTNFAGKYGLAPSCARLVYDYYALPGWEERFGALIAATDKIDSAQLSLNDILRPTGWVRLSNTVDPRTGFTTSHEYFVNLIELIRHKQLPEILADDDVHRRIQEYLKAADRFEWTLKENSRLDGDVVVTDFRGLRDIPLGSRFMVYALYPSASVSVRVFNEGKGGKNVVISVGRSILNRASSADVGCLMAEYGGGGHAAVGTCRVLADVADDAIEDIVS